MPIAIHTRYLPATMRRPSRVKASVRRPDGRIESVIFAIDYGNDTHEAAANELRARHWPAHSMHLAGETLDGRGYVFTIAPREV